MPVNIVRLGPEEGLRLRRIRLRSLQDAPEAFASTYAETRSRPTESWHQQVQDLATFVAVLGEEDVGVVRGGPDADLPKTSWLLSMWVAPEARGRGVGDALIGALVAWAREQGERTLLLEVADENLSAIRLYARHGFVPTGNTTTLPPPREHVSEHERALFL